MFVKKANILPKKFLTNFTVENKERDEIINEIVDDSFEHDDDDDPMGSILLKQFDCNMTLLPHQIMIFPNQYFKNITFDVAEYRFLSNDELR